MADLSVTVDGATLAGEETGEGVPVVLLHGLTATRRYVVMGSRNLERNGHRVIAYDARGHGESAPADAYTYPLLADDLGAVLDDRGVEGAMLVGASMGAHTLLRYALAHPERASAVVVITPAFDPEGDPDLERWDRLSAGLRDGGVDGFLAAYGEPAVPESWRETANRVLRRRLSAHAHPEAVADALREVPRSRPFEAWDELAALDVPAIVVGDSDDVDPEHPLGVAEAYARALPDARLVVEEAGKSPIAWQGSQLSALIAELGERAR